MLDIIDLVVRGAPHLTNSLGYSVHSVDVCLAEKAAIGVDRQISTERESLDRREVLRLAAPAEAELFQLCEYERGEVVVQEGRLNIRGLDTRIAPELFGDHTHLRQPGDVVSVVARHHLALGGRTLHGGGDDRRWLPQVSRAFDTRHDQCYAAVALLAAVEQPKDGLDDPS